MRSLTSDNEGASPTLTRGRPAWQRRHKTWHLAWHVTRPRLGKSLRQILWQDRVWSDICWQQRHHRAERIAGGVCECEYFMFRRSTVLVGKLKYFPIHPKRLWQLVKYWVEMFIFHFISFARDDMMTCVMQGPECDRRKQLISSHLSGAGPTCHYPDWSPDDHSECDESSSHSSSHHYSARCLLLSVDIVDIVDSEGKAALLASDCPHLSLRARINSLRPLTCFTPNSAQRPTNVWCSIYYHIQI